MKKVVVLIALYAMTATSLAFSKTVELDVIEETTERNESKQEELSLIKRMQASVGKTSGTAIMSVVTGGLMTGALKLVKGYDDGLAGPFMYSIFAGTLLLSLYDMINKTFGTEYGAAACWGAVASTVTSGLLLQAALD